ncbi:TraK family protein [Burkholderia cenocepacia]|uniref:TraK family protein n=1 Tax=Burkholderia cenocepacia TaxID=95486 RepID=UPI0015C56075|nr:TraK family protein [Burkholderia cenocepacia]
MTKNFPDELAAWVAQRRNAAKHKRNEYLVSFLAVRNDVIEATAAGYALKTIWEHMQATGRVSFRYETFLKYVRRHIANSSLPGVTPARRGSERGAQRQVENQRNWFVKEGGNSSDWRLQL